MRHLSILFLIGCSSVQSVKEPFVDIGIDGQPIIVETLDSASAPANNTNTILGAGDNLGLRTYEEIESSKKVMDPWLYLDGLLSY